MPFEWNALGEDFRESFTFGEFNRKPLAMIKADEKSVFEIRDLRRVRCLTKLRVRFSPLNGYRSPHNDDRASPICTYNTCIEDNEDFLLHRQNEEY